MILIPSSQFVRIEIQNEIGKLPPSFSFLQNKRLYNFQINLIKKNWDEERIVLTLPVNYNPEKIDLEAIHELGAEIRNYSPEASLGKHIADVIEKEKPKNLKILHGDTLFQKLPLEDDVVVIGKPHETADWNASNQRENSRLVWSGYFSFSNPQFFLRELQSNNFSFEEAVNSYGISIQLKFLENLHWYDFGHLEELHKAREKFTTERSFNNLKINKYEVRKTSKKRSKILYEYNWFKNMPSHLQKFLPNVYGFQEDDNQASYSMSYISGFSLSELMLFSNLEEFKWSNIINELSNFIGLQEEKIPKRSKDIAKENMNFILHAKNKERVNEMVKSGFVSESENLVFDNYSLGNINEVVLDLTRIVKKFPCIPAFCHGDLCFSNIIYLSRGNIIKLIDPRGIGSQSDTVIGDKRYDLAKISHSLIWGYDRILSGDITFDRSGHAFFETTKVPLNKNQEMLKEISINKGLNKVLLQEDIIALTALLFISMIPLHADCSKRQESLFANGLKIYKSLKIDNN